MADLNGVGGLNFYPNKNPRFLDLLNGVRGNPLMINWGSWDYFTLLIRVIVLMVQKIQTTTWDGVETL